MRLANTAHCSKHAAELHKNTIALTAAGKGLLAADESTGTIGKRFDAIKLENNEANRRAYRELLFTAPGALEAAVSGVIMYEETLFQSTAAGKKFVEVLAERGILTGIKIDAGTADIAGTDGETSTQGLDGLKARCEKYYAAGARFSKWRAVLKIGNGMPSDISIAENARGLARQAHISQQCGLVPIVEPEVLSDGSHSIEECAAATEKVLAAVVFELSKYKIFYEGCLLKPNMVTAGSEHKTPATPQEVAHWTVQVLSHTIPPAMGGITFLSGGQSEESATLNLNAINQSPLKRPWSLSFSYGRALQQSTIATWGGKAENVAAAQDVLLARAKANSEAALGKYAGGVGGAAANASLFQAGYTY